MTPIDLCDDIYIDFSKKEMSIECDHPDVPADESNLALKAVRVFYHSLKTKGCEVKNGLSIEIVKRIPPGGGLGGGSSNAATVLIALNTHFKTPFSKKELMKMGLELGADVPFFIFTYILYVNCNMSMVIFYVKIEKKLKPLIRDDWVRRKRSLSRLQI